MFYPGQRVKLVKHAADSNATLQIGSTGTVGERDGVVSRARSYTVAFPFPDTAPPAPPDTLAETAVPVRWDRHTMRPNYRNSADTRGFLWYVQSQCLAPLGEEDDLFAGGLPWENFDEGGEGG